MGKYSVALSDEARKHLKLWHKSGNKVVIKRIERIIRELEEHPQTGIGKPEQLKYQMTGLWSRKLDDKNRIVYDIRESEVSVYILSAKGHYTDH